MRADVNRAVRVACLSICKEASLLLAISGIFHLNLLIHVVWPSETLMHVVQSELATLRHCMHFGLALRQLQPAGQLAVFRSQVRLRALHRKQCNS